LDKYNRNAAGKKRPMSFYRNHLIKKTDFTPQSMNEFDVTPYESIYDNKIMRENANFMDVGGDPISPDDLFSSPGIIRNILYTKNLIGTKVRMKVTDTNIIHEYNRVVSNIEYPDEREGNPEIDPAETRSDDIKSFMYYMGNGGVERLVYLLVYLYGIHEMDKKCEIVTHKRPIDTGITGSSLFIK